MAALLAAGSASAQFSQLAWELGGDPAGSGLLSADTMLVVGPDNVACSGTPPGVTYYFMTAPFDGTIDVHINFDNQDTGFSYWHFEHPVIVRDGSVEIINDWGSQTSFDFEGDFSFEVTAGESIGFGIWSKDCLYGPGVIELSDFRYAPDGWGDLGFALPGSAGPPLLTGFGTLGPGDLIKLQLDDGLANAPAYLVLGFAAQVAPFKGGVMVPDPASAGAILPFVVGPAGRIVLVTNWPAGVPAGLLMWTQYFIVDAAGPVGFAASNALVVETQ